MKKVKVSTLIAGIICLFSFSVSTPTSSSAAPTKTIKISQSILSPYVKQQYLKPNVFSLAYPLEWELRTDENDTESNKYRVVLGSKSSNERTLGDISVEIVISNSMALLLRGSGRGSSFEERQDYFSMLIDRSFSKKDSSRGEISGRKYIGTIANKTLNGFTTNQIQFLIEYNGDFDMIINAFIVTQVPLSNGGSVVLTEDSYKKLINDFRELFTSLQILR